MVLPVIQNYLSQNNISYITAASEGGSYKVNLTKTNPNSGKTSVADVEIAPNEQGGYSLTGTRVKQNGETETKTKTYGAAEVAEFKQRLAEINSNYEASGQGIDPKKAIRPAFILDMIA
jgi:Tfp pilus assembly major pilin PilA